MKDPDARVFQSTLAQALKETGRLREALAIYRQLVVRWPGDAALFHDLAVSARELGYKQEALRAEQAALTVDPNDANAQNGLGLLHADAGRTSEAASAFEKATQLDPNNASFWTNLGNARRAGGDLTTAERSYRRALDLNSRYADAANGLGVILVQQRRAPEAITLFEQAIASDPQMYEARLNLGIAYQESGDRQRAAAQYRHLIATAPPGSKEKRAARELLAALR
jgi:superkiller protein 3